MKKIIQIILLLLCGITLSWGFAYGALFLIGTTFVFGLFIGIAVLLAITYPLSLLGEKLKQKFGIKYPMYLICGFCAPVVFWAVGFAHVNYLDSINYFDGFLAGLFEYLLTLSGLICSAALLIFMLMEKGIEILVEKKTKNKLSSEENNES